MTKLDLTFNDFVTYWNDTHNQHFHHFKSRRGQSLMNCLYIVWPEGYKRITNAHDKDGLNIDCFYNDDFIENTLKYLEKVWE